MSDTGDATAWPSPAPVSELTERGDTDSRSVAPLLRPSTRTPIALAPVAPECEGGGAAAMCTDDDGAADGEASLSPNDALPAPGVVDDAARCTTPCARGDDELPGRGCRRNERYR